MELRHLRYFLAIAKEKSFTAAAERLGVAQPALSQQMRALEGELGVTLIERGARTRGLTDAGIAFAARARRILLESEGAVEEMAAFAGARLGRVRFGSALQSLMQARGAALLAEFRRLHPGFRVAFREAHTRPLLELLARGRLDLALVHLGKGGGPPALKIEFERMPVEIERLYEEPLMLAVGPRHRLAGRGAWRGGGLGGDEVLSFRLGPPVARPAAPLAPPAPS